MCRKLYNPPTITLHSGCNSAVSKLVASVFIWKFPLLTTLLHLLACKTSYFIVQDIPYNLFSKSFYYRFFLNNCQNSAETWGCDDFMLPMNWFIAKFHATLNTVTITDKRTDASWDIFITWKINSGLVWAAGQYMKKKLGADYA